MRGFYKMNKNVLRKLSGTIYVLSLFFSCTTAPTKEEAVPMNEEVIVIENTSVQDIITKDTENEDIEEEILIDPVTEYEKKAESVVLSLLTLPSPSIKGSSFKKPFSIKVSNSDGTDAVNFPITIEYPHNIKGGVIEFTTVKAETNEHGIIEFLSPTANFSCSSVISFYPTPDLYSSNIDPIIQRISLKIPYLVKTNLTSAGGSICLVDYDKQGKAITNNGLTSSAVLGNLIRSGFSRIGNAEFYKEVADGDTDFLYKKANDLFGSITSYFIYGTVKYINTPVKDELGLYTVNLTADIVCIDMKTKDELFKTTIEVTGTGKTENSALNNARNEQLAPLLAEKIMYGI
jgi:hypothetical protein